VARWILDCPNCKGDFTHTEISPNDRLPDTFLRSTPKPEFPTGGLTITCPNCGNTSVYQRHQLIYQSA